MTKTLRDAKPAGLRRRDTQSIIDGSSKPPRVRKLGKKLSAKKRKPDFNKGSLRWLFCMRLRELAGEKKPTELATMLGVSDDLMRKYLGGTRVPDLDELPAVAKAFGLPDWTDLFRPKNS